MKLRIQTDEYAGYEVRYKPWWSPIWVLCSHYGRYPGINTFSTLERAEKFARNWPPAKEKSKVIKEIDTEEK